MNKAFQYPSSLRRVGHFGMKLNAIIPTAVIRDGCNGRRAGTCHHFETSRQFDHFVAVAHPDIQLRSAGFVYVIFNGLQQT